MSPISADNRSASSITTSSMPANGDAFYSAYITAACPSPQLS
jgi:hypothetical protein